MEEALQVQAALRLPTIIRPSFTMGGSGGGIAYNKGEFVAICERGLEASPTHELLIEESLLGWKEYEMEVVRDSKDPGRRRAGCRRTRSGARRRKHRRGRRC